MLTWIAYDLFLNINIDFQHLWSRTQSVVHQPVNYWAQMNHYEWWTTSVFDVIRIPTVPLWLRRSWHSFPRTVVNAWHRNWQNSQNQPGKGNKCIETGVASVVLHRLLNAYEERTHEIHAGFQPGRSYISSISAWRMSEHRWTVCRSIGILFTFPVSRRKHQKLGLRLRWFMIYSRSPVEVMFVRATLSYHSFTTP